MCRSMKELREQLPNRPNWKVTKLDSGSLPLNELYLIEYFVMCTSTNETIIFVIL